MGAPRILCIGVRMSSHVHKDSLPSGEESKRSDMGKAVSEKLDNWQVALFTASQRLNDLTGYSGIDNLKRQIEEQGEYALTFPLLIRNRAFQRSYTYAYTNQKKGGKEFGLYSNSGSSLTYGP